jgi:hypothetical protein
MHTEFLSGTQICRLKLHCLVEGNLCLSPQELLAKQPSKTCTAPPHHACRWHCSGSVHRSPVTTTICLEHVQHAGALQALADSS